MAESGSGNYMSMDELIKKAKQNNNSINIDDINYIDNNLISLNDIIAFLEKEGIRILPSNYENKEDIYENDEENHILYNDDALTTYLIEINKYPLLTKNEEQKLFLEYKYGSIEARNKLICSNLKLVVSIAKKYKSFLELKKMTLMDLISEGNKGLIKAIEKFDLSCDCRLSTYSTWWIRQSISRSIGDCSNIIRIPIHLIEKIRKIKEFQSEYYAKYGVEPSIKTCSEKLGYTENLIKNTMFVTKDIYSLDMPITKGYDDFTLEDIIVDDNDEFEIIENKMVFENIISNFESYLTEKELFVIVHRFGLNGNLPMKLQEMGDLLKNSRENIRTTEFRALKKIRRYIRSKEGQKN